VSDYDVMIIGAGSAGYSAAIYATRFGMKALLLGKEQGGQANEAFSVENYPGFNGISGMELMKKFRNQAEELGADMEAMGQVEKIGKQGKEFIVTAGEKKYKGKAVIIATGSRKRKLGITGEKELAGKGVAYCATCDAMFFRDKTLAVIGGGDSAVKSAILLTEYAKKVYIVYRKGRENMRAMPSWLKRMEENKKIERIFHSSPKKINGKEKVESITFEKKGKPFDLKVDGVFIEIGSVPESGLARELGVGLTEKGRIKVKDDMSTNVEGLFAAGDVTSGSNEFEQIITAASEGAIAAESAYKYITGSQWGS